MCLASSEQLTRQVFNQDIFIDQLSFSDGWLSLLTSSDFTRSNIVRSFLHHPSRRCTRLNPGKAGADWVVQANGSAGNAPYTDARIAA